MSEPAEPPDRDAFYLVHMLECIETIERYCAHDDIDSDQRTMDAVLRQLQILTESSKRISTELKAAWPDVSWRELAGLRNLRSCSLCVRRPITYRPQVGNLPHVAIRFLNLCGNQVVRREIHRLSF